jgi:hypothetical protein
MFDNFLMTKYKFIAAKNNYFHEIDGHAYREVMRMKGTGKRHVRYMVLEENDILYYYSVDVKMRPDIRFIDQYLRDKHYVIPVKFLNTGTNELLTEYLGVDTLDRLDRYSFRKRLLMTIKMLDIVSDLHRNFISHGDIRGCNFTWCSGRSEMFLFDWEHAEKNMYNFDGFFEDTRSLARTIYEFLNPVFDELNDNQMRLMFFLQQQAVAFNPLQVGLDDYLYDGVDFNNYLRTLIIPVFFN